MEPIEERGNLLFPFKDTVQKLYIPLSNTFHRLELNHMQDHAVRETDT